MDGAQLPQAGGQLTPLPETLGHRTQQDLLGVFPGPPLQLVPARDEDTGAHQEEADGDAYEDPDEGGMGRVHEWDLTMPPRASGTGPSGS